MVTLTQPAALVPPGPNGGGKHYHRADRRAVAAATTVRVGPHLIGGTALSIMAGPCSVESAEQLLATARSVKAAGATLLRGGAFKPRTSPYEFRGLGEEGLRLLADARAATGLPVITEVMSERDIDLIARYADVLQVGARNMSDFALLEELGRCGKPVMLKRGLQATIREWLLAAEYILAHGNSDVILCERGVRGFDNEFTRNTLDLNAVVVAKTESHLPVIVDPSHGTGRVDLVIPMARAAIAAGADGIMVEVHPDPPNALSDQKQQLDLPGFDRLMAELRPLAALLGRTIW